MLQRRVHVPCVPQLDCVEDQTERPEPVFLPFAVAVPELHSLRGPYSADRSMSVSLKPAKSRVEEFGRASQTGNSGNYGGAEEPSLRTDRRTGGALSERLELRSNADCTMAQGGVSFW